MNRPYYALAALVVALGGSAVAVGSARCQSATASIDASRALCATGPRHLVVAANLFVQFDTSWDASRRAAFATVSQGIDEERTSEYDDSCGYDPFRGERYDADVGAPPLAQVYESWPSDERIEAGFQEFEGQKMQPVCGGDELRCPYFSGYLAEQHCEQPCQDTAAEETSLADDDCQRAHEQWLAEHRNEVRAAPDECGIDSASPLNGDDWKTAPVTTPDWITDYLSACMPSLEEQYAQAEAQAALEAQNAGTESGETRDREEDVDGGPVVWSLSRIFSKVAEMCSEIVPSIDEQADELYQSADEALQQWNAMSSHLAMIRNDADVLAPYGDDYGNEIADDGLSSSLADRAEQERSVDPLLPVETIESREWLSSLADSLRAAGQLLMTVADGLEAEAERVLSAEIDQHWSR